MLSSTPNHDLFLKATFLLARPTGLAVCHEFEVLLFNHVVAAELAGGQPTVPDHRLHALDGDSQTRRHLFGGKQIHA